MCLYWVPGILELRECWVWHLLVCDRDQICIFAFDYVLLDNHAHLI